MTRPNTCVRRILGQIALPAIEASPAFVRGTAGNGVAERLNRNRKEPFSSVRSFETSAELRRALLAFTHHYNTRPLVAHRGDRTPAQIRADP